MKILSLLCLLSATAFGLSGERLHRYQRHVDKNIKIFRQYFVEYRHQKASCIIRQKKKELIEQNADALSDALRCLANAVAMEECAEKYTIIDQKIDDIKQLWKPHTGYPVLSIQSILTPSEKDEYGLITFFPFSDIIDWDHPVIKKYKHCACDEGFLVGPNW